MSKPKNSGRGRRSFGRARFALLLLAILLTAAPAAHAAPANDHFADAEALSGEPPIANFGNNQDATKEAGEPNHAGDPGGHSVWYSWTATYSGPVGISTCTFLVDTVLAVYTGSSVNALTPVASNDDGDGSSCGFRDGKVEFTATAGTTYRIAVDGKGGSDGFFELRLRGAPQNDDFADAESLSGLPVFQSGSNELGTKETGEPDHAGNSGGHSVWYSWIAPNSGPVRVSTCSFEDLDTVLAVYTGSAVGSVTQVAESDDSPSCEEGHSELVFDAVAGTAYRIAVDGNDGAAGDFELELTGPPANDDFAAADSIEAGLPAEAFDSNRLATKEAGEPNHAGGPGGHSVWYSWTPADSGPVSISICASGRLDTLLAVYTGVTVNALAPVVSREVPSDAECGSSDSDVELQATAGTTYRIAVDGKGGEEGDFRLTLEGPPANDDLLDAEVLGSSLPASTSGSTLAATKETGEPNHAGNGGGHSVWFSWTASSSGLVHLSTCFSSFDTLLAVYTGSAVNALTPVVGNDEADGLPCQPGHSEAQFVATAGTTYKIAVDGKDGARGSFDLTLTPPPANDDFGSPVSIGSELPVTKFSSNDRASKQVGEPDHAGDPGGRSVWYSWTAADSGPVKISTCAFWVDTLLAVYTGSSVGSLTPVASNDDGRSPRCSDANSEVRFTTTAGTAYRIAVDGAGGATGPFELTVATRPANDDFAKARTLSAFSMPAFDSGATDFATAEGSEPSHAGQVGGRSVWYSWTPSSSGRVSVSTCAFDERLDTLLAVYTGSAVNALTPVAGNDDAVDPSCELTDSEVEFETTAGTTYRIAVDGKAESEGNFTLRIDGQPINDDFAKARVLEPDLPAFSGGTNRAAGKEAGEPNHAANSGGHSLWYSWTPSSSGPVSISACSFDGADTLLAIYTGSAVNALTPVASNDDAAGGSCGSSGSEVKIAAMAGTTYRIAVDGKDGMTGELNLQLRGRPFNDDFGDAQDLELPTLNTRFNEHASKEGGEPNHAGDPGGHSVWYSWTPSNSGPVTLWTCAYDDLDTLLAVYDGPAVNALTPVASNDDATDPSCEATDSEVEFDAIAGTTYRIAVDGKGGTGGSFSLEWEERPVNDSFAQAAWISSSLPNFEFGRTRHASKEGGEPNHAGDPGGRSVWFKWTAPGSGPVVIDTCVNGFDTLLAVYTGSAVNALTPVASNDDAPDPRCEPINSEVAFDATAGTTYRIALDGKGGAHGWFELELRGRPHNDELAKAESVRSRLPSNGWGSNEMGTKQSGEPNHAGDPGGRSVWFKWTAPDSGPVAVDTCSSDFDTLLAVYTGSVMGGLTSVASNDDGSGDCGDRSELTFDAVANTTYKIAVDGAAGEEGWVELGLAAPGSSPAARSLAVTKSGSGGGAVISDPVGIECGSDCSHAFAEGTEVTLTAAPASGSAFVGWSGACSGTGTCTVSLNTDLAVAARFDLQSPPDEGSDGGGGTTPSSGEAPPLAATTAGTPPPPTSAAPSAPPTRPKRCRKGFKKKKVRGKLRCVKVKGSKRRRRR